MSKINNLFTQTFKDIKERKNNINVDSDVIKIQTSKDHNNVSGNILIEYNANSNSKSPNYFKLIYDDRERVLNNHKDNAFAYLLDLISSKDFFVQPRENHIDKTDFKEEIIKGIKYMDVNIFDFYKTGRNQVLSWNLLQGRKMSKAVAEEVVTHLIEKFNTIVDYIINTNLTNPNNDNTFKQLIVDLFAKYDEKQKRYFVYDFAHYTLLLPAIVQYLYLRQACENPAKMIGYIKKGSYFLPKYAGQNFNYTIKFEIEHPYFSQYWFSFLVEEVYFNKFGKQLYFCSRFNNPFKRRVHFSEYDGIVPVNGNKALINGVKIGYDHTQDHEPVYKRPGKQMWNVGKGVVKDTFGKYIMKLFERDVDNVPVYEGGKKIGTYNYKFDDYFEHAGYMYPPYQCVGDMGEFYRDYFNGGNTRNNYRPHETGLIYYFAESNPYSKDASTWKDNCRGTHYHNPKHIALQCYQKLSENDVMFVLSSPELSRQDNCLYWPEGYYYKSNWLCEKHWNEKPKNRGKRLHNKLIDDWTLPRLRGTHYPNYKWNWDNCLTSRITDRNRNIKVFNYQNVNRNCPRLHNSNARNNRIRNVRGIPVYRLKRKFTRLLSFNEYTIHQTGEWSDYNKYSSMYFVKYSDTNCDLLLNFRKYTVKCGEVQGNIVNTAATHCCENMFNHLNNVLILPPVNRPIVDINSSREVTNKICYGLSTQTRYRAYTTTVPDKEAYIEPFLSVRTVSIKNPDASYEDIHEQVKEASKSIIKKVKDKFTDHSKEPYTTTKSYAIRDELKALRDYELTTLYQTPDDIYYFDETSWEFWLDQLLTSKSLNILLEDIRTFIGSIPAIALTTRINMQMSPYVNKYNQTKSFIDLPLGPPMIRLDNYKFIDKFAKYSASIGYSLLKNGENYTYNLKDASNVIANKLNIQLLDVNKDRYVVDAGRISNTRIEGNYLDDFVDGQLNMCYDCTKLNNINDAYILCIPQRGANITEVTQFKSYIFNRKVFTKTHINDQLITKHSIPMILMIRKPLDDKLLDAYEFITKVHVSTFDIDYNRKTGNYQVRFDSRSNDQSINNLVYIYVTKASKCSSNYVVEKLVTQKNEDSIPVTFFSIKYNGDEIPVVPLILKQRI